MPTPATLRNAFDALRPPDADGRLDVFRGQPLDGRLLRYLGKDGSGRPAVLLATPPRGGPAALDYVLRNLTVRHGVRCRVGAEGGEGDERTYTVVRCMSAQAPVKECFLSVTATLLEALPEDFTVEDVSQAVSSLIDLFESLGAQPRKSAQGLWAELFVIARAADPVTAVEAWHSTATAPVDFTSSGDSLEVKSSSDGTRRHLFSADQVNPPAGGRLVVASVHAAADRSGQSVGELWREVGGLVSDRPGLAVKVDRVCHQALGDTWEQSVGRRYDLGRAERSLTFYDAADIPRLSTELPVGVSQVRFCSDLGLAPPLDASSVAGVLLPAVIRRRRTRVLRAGA